MKKSLLFLAFLVTVVLPLRVVHAQEVIRDFAVTAKVAHNRMYVVHEHIVYDFGSEEKHGIFRSIPITYLRKGATYNFHPTLRSVLVDGEPARYEESRDNGELHIKIGDPDTLITGVHGYDIDYATDRAVNFFPDGSEMYWNVTGNQWPVDIEQASYALTLPDAAASATIPTTCYTGPVSSVEQACTSTKKGSTVTFKTTRLLQSEEGFTIVVGMPPGLIQVPTKWEMFLMVVADNGVLAFPVIALLVMMALWWRKGRDPRLGTVIPLYESPGKRSPAELAAIDFDGGVPRQGVTATILDLARRGYLKIRSAEEKHLIGKTLKFTFVRTKPSDASLSDDEKILLDGLFASGDEVTSEDLATTHTYYKDVQKADKAVWDRLAAEALFDENPAMIRGIYIGSGILIGLVLMAFFSSRPLIGVSSFFTGVVIVIIGWYMPRRTKKGTGVYAELKGFRWFLSVTEKDRLAFHNPPERTSETFHELLAYAVALGVEKQWAKQFEGIMISQPAWAEGSGWSTMNAAAFASSIQTFSTNTSGMLSPSGSSGFSGGSSGGGGGGGGGGSW